MMLFRIFVLILKITVADSVSSFKKIPEAEVNDVYNSDDMVMVTSVTRKDECALICESLGELQCQSFNVRPQGTKLRCEIFDHIPTNGTQMAEDQTAKLYERCEPLHVVASTKERLNDNQTLVMLIDDKGAVYQAKSSDPTLRYIGNYSTVFEGFAGRVDDLFHGKVPPYGDVHFIREGEWVYCFLAVSETRQRFLPCEPKDQFPFRYTEITTSETNRIPNWITSDGVSTVFSVSPVFVAFLHIEVPKGFHADVLKPTGLNAYYECPPRRCPFFSHHTCPPPFCEYFTLFPQGSSGLFYSPSEIGVFHGAKFYVYDFNVHKIILRYSVCYEEDVAYMMRQP